MNAPVAIVTGAGGELGRATSTTLAASGFTVVAVDRNERALREFPDGVRTEAATRPTPRCPARSSTASSVKSDHLRCS